MSGGITTLKGPGVKGSSKRQSETAEDLVVLALEKGGLEDVVTILRDWCGSGEIRKFLNKLNHRDPVDR